MSHTARQEDVNDRLRLAFEVLVLLQLGTSFGLEQLGQREPRSGNHSNLQKTSS